MPKPFSKDLQLQNAADETGNGETFFVDHMGTLALQVSGTFEGTVTFEATLDGVNWVSLQMRSVTDGSIVTTATAPGIFVAAVAGLTAVRARISAYTSGSITVRGFAVEGPSQPVIGGDVTVEGGNSADVKVSLDGEAVVLGAGSAAIGTVTAAQAAHDSLNANANMQVGNADVSNANPVPISDAGGVITVDGSVEVSTVTLPTTVYSGEKTVASAGTPEVLGASQALESGVTVKALSTNIGFVKVGGATPYYKLSAGESVFVEIDNVASVYLDVTVNGEGATFIAS
jgi:hypothetical protein